MFTTIRRLDLLRFGGALHISPHARQEHTKKAPHPSEEYLAASIAKGFVVVQQPAGMRRVADLRHKYRALSPVDLEGLAWALESGALFLADVNAHPG